MKAGHTLLDDAASRHVLVLGKGPSLTREAFNAAMQGRTVVGINQVAENFPVDIAFFIDIEPMLEIADSLIASTCKVVLPWHPNRRTWRKSRSKPMQQSLLDLASIDGPLSIFERQQRLYYFHTRTPMFGGERNVYPPNLVSLSSLLQLLAEAGASDVKTLGVDGGSGYSSAIGASPLPTQLHQGYDRQFPILRKIALSKGLRMERANEMPLNIYVGCEPPQELPARVLEHSILRHTSMPVRVQRLNELIGPGREAEGRTAFSLQRFMIPSLNRREGLAVYLDSDMLVYHDVAELLALRDPQVAITSAEAPPDSGRAPQCSVMVIDCEKAAWDFDQIVDLSKSTYESAMFDLSFEPSKRAGLPYQWNSLERFEDGTRLLHFTDMDRQPWISAVNPLAPIWFDALFAAMADRQLSFDTIVQDVKRGWIRPGLLWQAEHGERNPLALPRTERLKDELYTPPHTVARFSKHNTPMVRASLAVAKRALHWVRGQRNA